jgi:hypothetical protein
MRHPNVQQLAALSGLFKRSLDICQPDNVAELGVVGGNGLEHIEHRAPADRRPMRRTDELG